MRVPDAVTRALQDARSIGVLTGAGVSAESGIATFRDAQTGLWSQFRPEDLATPEAFERDPELVWKWYAWRREQVTEADPNPGHRALAQLQQLRPTHIVTQNVDGLHQRGGAKDVIELHGSIMRTLCHRTLEPVDDDYLAKQTALPPPSPHHPDGLCRPGVVWFGEALPGVALQRAFDIAEASDVFISAGTSTVVEPAASLPLAAKRAGAFLIEINPAQTPLSPHCDATLLGPSGEVLPQLVESLATT
ncbi:MAG: NAD-dependent deacylase [Pseudomonadota bacterium]